MTLRFMNHLHIKNPHARILLSKIAPYNEKDVLSFSDFQNFYPVVFSRTMNEMFVVLITDPKDFVLERDEMIDNHLTIEFGIMNDYEFMKMKIHHGINNEESQKLVLEFEQNRDDLIKVI